MMVFSHLAFEQPSLIRYLIYYGVLTSRRGAHRSLAYVLVEERLGLYGLLFETQLVSRGSRNRKEQSIVAKYDLGLRVKLELSYV